MKKKFVLPIIFCSFILLLSVLTLVLPKKQKSENEKRVLADFPSLSWENIRKGDAMTEFDTYLADHFAFRDMWVGINAYTTLWEGGNGRSGIYACDDGYLIPAPEKYDATQAEKNLRAIDKFSKKLGVTSHLLAVPNPGYVMEDILPTVHQKYHDDELYTLASSELQNTKLIEIRESFADAYSSDKQIYYKTDHHTAADGSLLMYSEYCNAVGTNPKNFNIDRTVSGFYGTSYSKSGLWLKDPDNVDILLPDNTNHFEVTIGEDVSDSLFYEEKLEGRDKYEVFLNGNNPLVVIKNKDNANGKKLMIIKDSYAHCLATLLANDYETIVMVDLRYYKKPASKLAEEYGINELLFVYGANNLASSKDISWLSIG